MKDQIRKKLCLIISAAMLFSLLLNVLLQIKQVDRSMRTESENLFWQINQILVQNEKDVEQIKEDFRQSCLISAKAAAYIMQSRPEIIGNQPELEKIAGLLQIDEFHIFDTEGNLYAGSQPKYFGMNFNSGEQMQFFLPMLEDRSLELCQEITPNTAESKLMQYAAVWQEDGKGIVQIGMEPDRVVEAMKRNELSYIFSILTADEGNVICAVDPDTHEVLGSTDGNYIKKDVKELGIKAENLTNGEEGFRTKFDGEKSYCVFSRTGSVILGRICPESRMYRSVYKSTRMLSIYLALLGILIIAAISKYLDRYIVRGISSVNKKLRVITGGDLDTRVSVDTTPEFLELSEQINEMIESLLDVPNKFSAVLDIVSIPVGIYEYRLNMKRVLTTSGLGGILCLSSEEIQRILSDHELFEAKLEEIRRCPEEVERGIYRLPWEEERYIRMDSIPYENGILGILLDVTEDMVEKHHIVYERDRDFLTGLYNRRAFYSEFQGILDEKKDCGHAVLFLADADGLKSVNDRYGHAGGDEYLRGIADVLRACPARKKVVSRLGGDEFALLIYGGKDRAELERYINAIQETVNKSSVEINGQVSMPVRFSAGYAFFPEDGSDCHELMELVDMRMYEAKKARGYEPRNKSGI